MINRLRGLFQRYAQSHRHIEAGGFGLTSGSEPLQGYVDRVVLNGTRVTFFGWSTADRILLSGADGQSVTRPDIPRQDVADAIGVSPRVGFEITQGYGNGQFSLIVETGGVQHRHDIAPISPAGSAATVGNWRCGSCGPCCRCRPRSSGPCAMMTRRPVRRSNLPWA